MNTGSDGALPLVVCYESSQGAATISGANLATDPRLTTRNRHKPHSSATQRQPDQTSSRACDIVPNKRDLLELGTHLRSTTPQRRRRQAAA